MPSRGNAAGRMLAWLTHPVSVLGLVSLALNDHVLKAAWPGPVTGKLSDIAGMLMFPPLLASVLALAVPRLPVRALAVTSLALTGLAFTAAKGFAAGAEVADLLWSAARGPSHLLADPTDLIALPALLLSGWAFSRTAALSDGTARTLLTLLLVPAGLLATAATTMPDYPSATWVGEVNGQLARNSGNSYAYYQTDPQPFGISYSTDAGLTWLDKPEWTPQPTPTVSPDPRSPITYVDRLPAMLTLDCAGTVCYRVVPGELHVQRSTDGGQHWQTDWRVAGLQYARLANGYPDLGDRVVNLSSLGLVVHETAGGRHVVLVANGRDGLLRRDEAGHWDRQDAPGPLSGTSVVVLHYLVLVLTVMLLVLFLPLRRLSPPQRQLPSTAQALWLSANLLVPVAVTATAIAVLYPAAVTSPVSIVFTVLALAAETGWAVTMCRLGRLPASRVGWGLGIASTTGLVTLYALQRPLEEPFAVQPGLGAVATGTFVALAGAVTLNVLAGRLRRQP